MARNVVLIGFMGAGKSAVGLALAERLGWRLFDTDEMVVAETGQEISAIWADGGEEAFRAHEYDAVVHACAGVGRVIACGGGAVLQLRTYGILKGAGTIVYLRAPTEVLRARIGDGGGRPLLAGDPAAFDRLLGARAPAYEAAADEIVDIDGRSPEEIAAEIAELVA